MIAPEDVAGRCATFAERRAAEFAAPDDERIVEQTTLAEVADERGHRPVGAGHLLRQAVTDILARSGAMEVPAPVEELHEAHPLLEQAAAEQAVVGKAGLARAWRRRPRAPTPARAKCPSPRARWPACGTPARTARCGSRLRVAELAGLPFVEIAQRVEGVATHGAVDAGRIADVEHRVALGAALHALEHRRQNPVPQTAWPALGCVPLLISTTNPGRFSLAESRGRR
jgi:hypothetical protein